MVCGGATRSSSPCLPSALATHQPLLLPSLPLLGQFSCHLPLAHKQVLSSPSLKIFAYSPTYSQRYPLSLHDLYILTTDPSQTVKCLPPSIHPIIALLPPSIPPSLSVLPLLHPSVCSLSPHSLPRTHSPSLLPSPFQVIGEGCSGTDARESVDFLCDFIKNRHSSPPLQAEAAGTMKVKAQVPQDARPGSSFSCQAS